MKPKFRSLLLASSALLSISHSHAASGAWNVDAAGNWFDDVNWNPAAAPGATSGTTNTDTASFGIALTAPRIITVDANRNLQGINFTNLSGFGYTLSGGNLLLTNGGLIQTSGAGTAHTDTISSAIALQGDGGTASFTAGSSTNTRLLVIGGGVTGVSTGANVTTLTLNGANSGANAVTGIIGDGSGGGKLALTKSGAGLWSLSGANTYTGGTTLNGGTVAISNATAFGAGAISVTGNSRINATALTFANNISIDATRVLTIGTTGAASSTSTFSGAITGAGGITLAQGALSSTVVNLSSTSNTFTGNLTLPSVAGTNDFINFASIGDGGSIVFGRQSWAAQVRYTGAANLNLSTRSISLASTFGGLGNTPGLDGGGTPINMFANNGAGVVTIGSDMAIASSANNGVFYFGGSNSGNNTFSGLIADNPGTGTLGIGKWDAGKWILSNANNSFNGNVYLMNGTLSVTNIQALGNGSVIQMGHNSTTGTLEYTGSANATTSKQIAIGNLTNNNAGGATILNNGTGTLSFSTGTFNTLTPTWTLPFGVINVTRTLTLGGTNAGNNEIQGAIQNNAAGALVSITKSGAGTWLLSGANTYSGGTSVNVGTLTFRNTSAKPASGTTTVASGATLGLGVGGGAGFFGSTDIGNLFAGTMTNVTNSATSNVGIDTTAGNFTHANSIASTTRGLVKLGSNTLTLTGTNLYSGTTTIRTGTLQLGDGAVGNDGTIASSLSVVNNAALVYNRNGSSTYGGVISGTGTVTKTGAGTQILTGANTYSGATAINNGTMEVRNSSALGTGSVSVAAGGKLVANANSLTIANNITLNGTTTNGAIYNGNRPAGNVTNLSGTMTLNSTSNISSWWNDKTLQLSGKITGAGGLNFDLQTGSVGGRYLVSGATNDYAGATSVTGSATPQFGYTGQAMLYLGANNALTTTTDLTLNNADLYLNGRSQTLASISGSGSFSVQNGSTTAATLTLGSGDTTSSFGGTIKDDGISVTNTSNTPTIITGTVALTKIGNGTLTLSGANTYTGATSVNGGTLEIASGGSTASGSAVTVSNSGSALVVNGTVNGSVLINASTTLSGSGTIGGATMVNGTYGPGNSPGTMIHLNTVTLGGTIIMEIDGVNGAGVTGGHDFVNLTGSGAAGVLTYGGAMTLDIGTIFGNGSYTFNLFDFASETGTFSTISLADQYSGNLLDSGGGIWNLTSGSDTWQFTQSTGVLSLNVVPEPNAAALLGALGTLLLLRRRR